MLILSPNDCCKLCYVLFLPLFLTIFIVDGGLLYINLCVSYKFVTNNLQNDIRKIRLGDFLSTGWSKYIVAYVVIHE